MAQPHWNVGGLTMTHIRLGLELGRGAQGVVYSGITHLGEKVAVKVSPVDHSQTARELRAMKLFAEAGVNHTHLISWRLPPLERPFYRQILQVLDLCDGDLILLAQSRVLLEVDLQKLFSQVASALNTCHALGVYHMDVKPENMLFKFLGSGSIVVKVSDFGFSSVNMHVRQKYGTRAYAPPEAFPEFGRVFDASKADVWALGISILGLVTGMFPWTAPVLEDPGYALWSRTCSRASDAATAAAAAAVARQRSFWRRWFACGRRRHGDDGGDVNTPLVPQRRVRENLGQQLLDMCMEGAKQLDRSPVRRQWSSALRHLLSGMLHPDPDQRFSMAEVVSHPWLSSGAA